MSNKVINQIRDCFTIKLLEIQPKYILQTRQHFINLVLNMANAYNKFKVLSEKV